MARPSLWCSLDVPWAITFKKNFEKILKTSSYQQNGAFASSAFLEFRFQKFPSLSRTNSKSGRHGALIFEQKDDIL